MTDPWFSPEVVRGFSLFSLLSLFALLQPVVEQGRLRSIVMGIWTAVIAFAGLLVLAAIVGMFAGQPSYVVKGLALTGLLVGSLFAAILPLVRRAYDEAEVRKTIAADL